MYCEIRVTFNTMETYPSKAESRKGAGLWRGGGAVLEVGQALLAVHVHGSWRGAGRERSRQRGSSRRVGAVAAENCGT